MIDPKGAKLFTPPPPKGTQLRIFWSMATTALNECEKPEPNLPELARVFGGVRNMLEPGLRDESTTNAERANVRNKEIIKKLTAYNDEVVKLVVRLNSEIQKRDALLAQAMPIVEGLVTMLRAHGIDPFQNGGGTVQ